MKLQLLPILILTVLTSACTGSDVAVSEVLRVKTVDHLRFGDFDPVKIKGKQPKEFPIHGIDISRHNKAIDWARIKRNGVAFAFMKATEGRDDKDRRFDEFWRDTGRVKMPRSGYHFYYFCAPPEAQAANYIRTVPKSDSALPPILDVEWNPESPTCRKRPKRAVVVNRLKRWLDKVESHYGQKPIIYTTVDFYEENFSGGALPGYHYWLRSVKAEPKFIYGKRPWVFWQYTGTGNIPGVEGPVDINAFKGSKKEWASWMAKNRR